MTTQPDNPKTRDALKRAAEEFGEGWLKPIAPYFPPAEIGETVEEHSLDKWMIARAEPNMEAEAVKSLERVGVECWYPEARHIRTIPLRHLSSKNRHRRAQEKAVVTKRNALPGYLFVRDLLHQYDVNMLHELTGVAGLCRFGDRIATVADLEIEIMRVAAARGTYDRYSTAQAERVYLHQMEREVIERYELARNPAGDKRYTGQSKIIGRTCESVGLVVFTKILDRISRTLVLAASPDSSADAQQGYHAESKDMGDR